MPQAPDSYRASATIGETSVEDDGFATRVRSAMAWRWGTQFLAQIITWGATLAVVRLLDPSDYGLFAMTQVVLAAMAFLNGYSFATSLIQAPEIDSHKISQVFGMLILANGLVASVQFLLAPYIAAYYGQPVVADMLRVQAVLFLTVPFIALPSALLARRIEFRNQGVVNLMCAAVGACVALGMAWYGYGVWALVYAPIAMSLARALGLTIAARLLVWPNFNFRGAREILSFGGALTLCQLFWIIQSQSDIFIAGRAFDTHELGLYSEALFLTLIVTGRFLPPINEVAFPAYSELHKLGKPMAPFFLRTMRTVFLVTAPIYVGLSLTADAAVLTLFGPKWAEMAPIAAGLAIAMPAMALQIICSPATNAMGSPRIYVTTSIIGAVIYPSLFLIGIAYGPMGLVYAWWIAAPTLLLITLALTLPAVGLSFGKLFAELMPVALACGVMALTVTVAQATIGPSEPPLQLLLIVPVGALAYGATIWFGWPALLRETWTMLRRGKSPPLPA